MGMKRPVLDPDSAAQTAGSRTAELCETCGEDTATGTVLYSDRRVLNGKNGRTYVCAMCVQRMNAARHGAQLTDEELRRAINTAGIVGQAWGGPTD
jgi:protein-arginine kinase activator protein McsA